MVLQKGLKRLFKYVEKRSIVCDCTHGKIINFEVFTQNGCYDNQPHPFNVLFYSL